MQITKKHKRKKQLKGMQMNNYHGITNGKLRYKKGGKKYANKSN